MRALLTPLLAGWTLLLAACSQPVTDGATNDNTPIAWVSDEAEMLSAESEERITARLIELERETSDQLLVWTVETLDGRRI